MSRPTIAILQKLRPMAENFGIEWSDQL